MYKETMIRKSSKQQMLANIICSFLLLVDVNGFSAIYDPLLSTHKRSVTSELTKEQITVLQNEATAQTKNGLDRRREWNALFFPVQENPDPVACSVSQIDINDADDVAAWGPLSTTLPVDFPPGCWLRLGPNTFQWTDGFLDGDGMVHCVTFPPTSTAANSDMNKDSQYTSTYVETVGRVLEEKLGTDKKYKGSLGSAPRGYPLVQALIENMITFKTLQGQKDTANTALAEHEGRVLALMEQSLPSEISIDSLGRVKTIEALTDLEGSLSRSDPLTGGTFSAHGRTCPETGDRIHVSYSANDPIARVDIFGESKALKTTSIDTSTQKTNSNNDSKGWKLKRSVSVKLPTGVPVMIHDCAVTPNYVIVLDFPLTVRPARMIMDSFPVAYEPENGARIGLVSRNDPSAETKWFDVAPGVILHTVNAYEDPESAQVIFQAGFSKPSGEESFIQSYATTFLHEWVLDLKTGKATERCLNPNVLVDFPVLSKSQVGKRTSSVICGHVSSIPKGLEVYKMPQEGIMFDGCVRLALEDDDTKGVKKGDVLGKYKLPETWHAVTEPTVIDKTDGSGEYIIMGVTQIIDRAPAADDVKEEQFFRRSRLIVLDGNELNSKPVYSLNLPGPLPYGLHSLYLEWDKLKTVQSVI